MNGNCKLIFGDCMEKLKELPDESVDLIITDPPYGINYSSNWSTDLAYRKNVADTIDWDDDFDYPKIHELLMSKLKSSGQAYVFCSWKNFGLMPKCINLIIWDKMQNGMGDLTSWGGAHEFICFYSKGNNALNRRARNILHICNVENNFNQVHPTQKPVELMSVIIGLASKRGGGRA